MEKELSNECAGSSKKSPEYFMAEALNEAKKALTEDEIPIGAVVVFNGEVIGRGHNEREKQQDSTLHAEISAIKEACKNLGSWRLEGCDLYVTLEPCSMCAGAIILSRIQRIYYGAKDPKAGAAGSVIDILKQDLFNHNVEVFAGICENECSEILSEFFRDLRKRR